MKTKTIVLLFISIFTTTILFAAPPKNGKVTVKWSFKGIVEGYDHQNKIAVFVDGEKVGESSQQLESKPNSYSVSVPVGKHSIKIMDYAYYEGKWEEHTIENTYSIDCSYESDIKVKKKTSITLLFDIDSGTTAKVK